MMNLLTLAKFPFLKDAKSYVRNEGATVHELLTDPLFESARYIAIERLENVLNKKDIGNRVLSTESERIMELFSNPLARMITVCIQDDFFTRSYALSEAVHMYKNLLKEPLSFIFDVAKEFNIMVDFSDDLGQSKILFTHYLTCAPTHYKKWKMINRTMNNGFISLSKKDLARILQEVLRKRINQELENRSPHRDALSVFSEDISRIKNKVLTQRKKHEVLPMGKLKVEYLPPCLKNILSLIQAGENVAHMGRFALVAFFNSLNLSTDEIIKLFSKAPDFEEDKTRYQIEHILGKTGSTSYKPPGCDKLKTYGLCPSEEVDEMCKRTNHPTSYYRWKWKNEKKRKNKRKEKAK